MAQELIKHTWCDVHLANDEHVAGQTVVNPVDPNQEADLCDEHKDQVDSITASIKTWFDKYGRQSAKTETRTRQAPAKKAKAPRRNRRDALPLNCTICGRSDFKRRSELRHHVQDAHNKDLVVLEAADPSVYTPFACNLGAQTKDCKAAVGSVQGLGMHRWRAHGIPMKDTYAEFAEISAEVTKARKRGERWYPPGTAPAAPVTEEEQPPPQSLSDVEQLQKALEEGSPGSRPQGVFH